MPNFVSPGAMAAQSLDDYLVQRELEKRQRLLDELNRRNVESDNARADRSLDLTGKQLNYNIGRDKAALRSEHEAGKLARENAKAAGLQERAQREALAGLYPEHQQPAILAGVDPGSFPSGPEPFKPQLSNMGDQGLWITGEDGVPRLVEGSRAPAIVDGGGTGAPSGIARMAAENPDVLQGTTPTLRGEAIEGIANDPELRAQYEDARMEPIRARANDIMRSMDALLQTSDTGDQSLTPGARAVFGEFTPTWARGFIAPGDATMADAADAQASLANVIGQEVVGLIADMKAQSSTGATGFGQLNRAELDILLASANRLTQRISEPAALEELKAIYAGLQKVLQQPSAGGDDTDALLNELLGQ